MKGGVSESESTVQCLAALLNDPDFKELNTRSREFNLFDALNISRQELRHSDCLAFLLNPKETHGLGSALLTNLVSTLLESDSGSYTTSLLWEWDDAVLRREWNNLDIFVLNRQERVTLTIENKVGSSEHSNQLERYENIVKTEFPSYTNIFCFLCADGNEPSRETWIPCDNQQINSLLSEILITQTVSPQVLTLIQHYQALINNQMSEETELDQLSARVIEKHGKALAELFKRMPNDNAINWESFKTSIEEYENLVYVNSTNKGMHFKPVNWDNPLMGQVSAPDWDRVYFYLTQDFRGVMVYLVIDPSCPEELRRHIYYKALEQRPPFTATRRTPTKNWNRLYVHELVNANELSEETPLGG